MKQYNVGIIGATGMVGQRFTTLLDGHPWFNIKVLAASGRSAGKTYEEAVGTRWKISNKPMPDTVKDMVIMDAVEDMEKIGSMVDFVFCAVNLPKAEVRELEDLYANANIPVVSNNSAHRHTPDVPMVVPELNPDHLDIIAAQRKRRGTDRGFVAVKSTARFRATVPPCSRCMRSTVSRTSSSARTRPFPVPARPSSSSRKFWTTSFRSSAAKKKNPKWSR